MRLRFSLKTFVVAFIVLSLYLGWTLNTRSRHSRAADLLRADGAFIYDGFFEAFGPNYFWTPDFPVPSTSPITIWPKWVDNRPWLGTFGWFACMLEGERFNRSQLELLPRLMRLETVYLYHTSIEPEDIAVLEGLPHLKYLYIADDNLTDEVIPYLSRLKQVKYFTLNLPQVGEDQFQVLADCFPNCQREYF